MTADYYAYDDEWTDEWDLEWDEGPFQAPRLGLPPVEGLVILLAVVTAATLVAAFLLLPGQPAVRPAASIPVAPSVPQTQIEEPQSAPFVGSGGPDFFTAPYGEYILTQGAHGQSYGHLAIDIAAGKGEPIRSPINGRVSERFVDGIGNPVLVIENERYEVTLLHGLYAVEMGEELRAGDIVGAESNMGNTRDMQGRSCRGRDCGYHTHLNVYDKQLGQNVNPLLLLSSS